MEEDTDIVMNVQGDFYYINTLNIFTKYVSVVKQIYCCFPLIS